MLRKFAHFGLISLIVIALSILLNNSLSIGGKAIPPIAKFFSPFTGFWQNAESNNEYKGSILRFEELQYPVTVVFDDRLVPHIFAQNISDALHVQGYLHAKYRLFQMDLSTRSAAGRLTEILGPEALSNDQFHRHIGMTYAAENAVKGWKSFPEKYRLLQAYSEGVNRYIANLKPSEYPLEFKLLNYQPEPWSTYKTALFFKNMALTLCFGHDDLEATNMLKHFGPEVFNSLYPEYNPRQRPVIPDSTFIDEMALPEEVLSHIPAPNQYLPALPFQEFPAGIGSNNWAVSAEKTKNGYAILCNDPHLSLTLPSIWYELQIHTPEFNAYGVSLPGIPGIIIGFNEHIAWGLTNAGHDVLDLFEMDWADEERTQYRIDGKINQVSIREEHYKIKRTKPFVETIKYTEFGPVVPEGSTWETRAGLSARWLAHDVPDRPELTVFLDICQSKSYEDFDQSLIHYIAPAQNFAFASTDGEVGMKVNGRFPVKDNQEGRFIKNGSSSLNNWHRFIPRDQVPSVYKPDRGYVSSANQHSTSPAYPYYYNGGFEDYRGRVINNMLDTMREITIEQMKKMQLNTLSLKAADLLPFLISKMKTLELSDFGLEVLREIENWDGTYEPESRAATYFNEWYRHIYENTFDEIDELKDTMAVLWPESWRLIEWVEMNPDNLFFDIKETENIENAGDIILLSFEQMMETVAEAKENGDSLEWAKFRKSSIRHLTRIPAFSINDLPVGGHGDAIQANTGQHGPSWRMIVELRPGNIRAYGVYPGGQSGEPGSFYYNTGVNAWATGEYFDLIFAKSIDDFEINSILFKQTFTK